MSHFPCLEKDYIQNFLNPYDSCLPDNWKSHLNSQVLDKYLEIKRDQKQKVSQILPRYNIFPKSYDEYNVYTTSYDLDRLQRIKNASNLKYDKANKSRQKNSKSQQKDDLVFMRSASQMVVGTQNPNILRNDTDNKSAVKFYESKSTKSLTETQITPSKLSKKIYYRSPENNALESDSQMSIQKSLGKNRKERQNKSWTSNVRSSKNERNNKQCQDRGNFYNVQSAITVIKRHNPNQDYYYSNVDRQNGGLGSQWTNRHIKNLDIREKLQRNSKKHNQSQSKEFDIGKNFLQNKQLKIIEQKKMYGDQEIIESSRTSRRNQKDQLKYAQNKGSQGSSNRNKDSRHSNQSERKNCVTQSPFNPKYQKSRIQDLSQNRQTFEKIRQRQSDFRTQEGRKKGIQQLNPTSNKESINHLNQRQNIHEQITQHKKSSKLQQETTYNSSSQHREQKQANFNLGNRFDKKQIDASWVQTDKVDQKLQQYYGEEYERIKAERDYLRKHFIQHLEKKHPQQLPYKQLTLIKVDETGKKLIVSQRVVPLSRNKKDQQIFEVSRVE